jgi:hypothetical protein
MSFRKAQYLPETSALRRVHLRVKTSRGLQSEA